jgi:glycosyltransferase involved in cell wall biosynthesis
LKFKTKIAIKLPIPKWNETHRWGDYHFGTALKREFERNGCEVIIQILSEWYNGEDNDCDVVIVLRGLTKYNPKEQHFNIMWNISHPDMVTLDEYNHYDHVFIASEFWADTIRKKVNVPVDTLLQCTDPELFYHEYNSDYDHELLFVGLYRPGNRKIIEDIIPTDKDLAIYGPCWQYSTLDKRYWINNYIPNNELRKAYSSCKILLNDHWKDMKEKGFISNRLFDGFASGAFIISDNVKGASDIFGDLLVTYKSPDELKNLVDKYLENDDERIKKAQQGMRLIDKHHTYQNRVQDMLKIIKSNTTHKIDFQYSDLEPEVFIHRLWNSLIFPIINNFQAQHIVEISSKGLVLTKNILEYCQDNQAYLTLITSSFNKRLDSFKNEYNDHFEIFREKSPICLAKLKRYDIIFLDGSRDLNIIQKELKVIESQFKSKTLPIVFLYDVNTANNAITNEEESDNTLSDYILTIQKYVNESKSDLCYLVTEAFQGLIVVYSKDGRNEQVIENTFKNINLLKSLEIERQKFSIAYNGSKKLIDSLETKLINKKIDLENKEEEIQNLQTKEEKMTQKLQTKEEKMTQKLQNKEEKLKLTKIQLNNQINNANKLIRERKILIEKNNEIENQLGKLRAQFDTLSNNLLEMKYHNGENRPLSQKFISMIPSLYILSMMNKTGIKNSLVNIRGYYSIKKNKLFDIGFYLKNNHDIQLTGQDPIIHYLYHGFEEGRQPNPNFDCDKYIQNHSDVRNSDLNPLVHYSIYGRKEKRNLRKIKKI